MWREFAVARHVLGARGGLEQDTAQTRKHPTLGQPLNFVWRMNQAAAEDAPGLSTGPDGAFLWQPKAIRMQGELSVWRQASPQTVSALLSANFLAAARRWLCPTKVCTRWSGKEGQKGVMGGERRKCVNG